MNKEKSSKEQIGGFGTTAKATASAGAMDVWDVTRRERAFNTVDAGPGNRELQFSPDGSRIAVASPGFVRMVDAHTGQLYPQTMSHGSHVNQMEFSSDGHRLATASYDQTARVWDALTTKSPFPALRHSSPVSEARFSADGRRLLTAGADGTLRLWDLPSGIGERLKMSYKITSRIQVRFGPDGQRVLVFGERVRVGIRPPSARMDGDTCCSRTSIRWRS